MLQKTMRTPGCVSPPATVKKCSHISALKSRCVLRGNNAPKGKTAVRRSVLPTKTISQTAVEAAFNPPTLPHLDESYESLCAFSSYSNWIIPGYVMLGRYPYVEPNLCRTRDQGDAQIEAILHSGVTTFVCLQEEIPPQNEMRLAGSGGFLPYIGTATLVAAAISDPPTIHEVNGLRTPDLDRYLPPRRRPSPFPSRRRLEVDFVHRPIVDLGIPEDQKLADLLDDLTSRLACGEKLYIHCWGGRGRAGTVGTTLLAKLYGMDADEALERVQRAFDTRKDEQRKSPETPEQHTFVRNFIEQLQTKHS